MLETPQFGTTIVLRLKPSNDAPERRLRYLARIAGQIGRHCRDIGDAWLQPFKSAVLAEATASRRTRSKSSSPRAAIEAACPIEEPARSSLDLWDEKPAAR